MKKKSILLLLLSVHVLRAQFCFTTSSFSFVPGEYPHAICAGDFNNDGKNDLAISAGNLNPLTLYFGTGTGSFGTGVSCAANYDVQSICTGDFNHDGNADLAVANCSGNKVSVMLGAGNGTFSAPSVSQVGAYPNSITTADFNGDGNTDLATVNQTSSNISILLGTASGIFGPVTNFLLRPNSGGMVIASTDVNNDGNIDLVIANMNIDSVSVLLGNGTGGFSGFINFPTEPAPSSVAYADLNGDGNQDLVTASVGNNNISVLLGSGNGSFGAPVNFSVGQQPYSITLADLNGDGKTDALVANNTVNNISLLPGDGLGNFGAATNYTTGSNPFDIAVADFNGDSKKDIAVTNITAHYISRFLNCSSTGIFHVTDEEPAFVYPNPSSGKFTIDVKNPGVHLVEITDMSGKILFKKNINDAGILEINDVLDEGIYSIKIEGTNSVTNKRLIILK